MLHEATTFSIFVQHYVVQSPMAKRKTYELKRRAEAMARTRRRITEAAVALHESVGPAQTSVSEIARRAGVDRVTVYRHFPDEAALFRACSQHYAARNPLPDPAQWSELADPRERLRSALAAVYGYYERNEALLANVTRDAERMPALGAVGARRRQWLAEVEQELAQGWDRDVQQVGHAVALALDFRTWQTLVRKRGLSSRQAIRLMLAMVGGAACK
jgi:AcrR family transcriptional regulator